MSDSNHPRPDPPAGSGAPKPAGYPDSLKRFHGGKAATLEAAKRFIAGDDFDVLQSFSAATARYILEERAHRGFVRPPADLKVLEVGCGVGRMMSGFRACGVRHIDGVDISDGMIAHAGTLPELAGSRFFLSSGDDLGGAPADSYDLIYATLVFQRICNRFVRLKLLERIQNCLNDYGVVVVQMHYYPQTRRTDIPDGHARWSECRRTCTDDFPAEVFLTPDDLPEAMQDFRTFFADVGFVCGEFPDIADRMAKHPHYGRQPWEHIFISASKRPRLTSFIHQPA